MSGRQRGKGRNHWFIFPRLLMIRELLDAALRLFPFHNPHQNLFAQGQIPLTENLPRVHGPVVGARSCERGVRAGGDGGLQPAVWSYGDNEMLKLQIQMGSFSLVQLQLLLQRGVKRRFRRIRGN